LLLALLFLAPAVHAQKFEKFTRSEAACADELFKLFESARQGRGEEIIEREFAPLWLQPTSFTPAQRQQIYDVLDALLKNKN
jgi:hypothetical protein